MDLPPRGRHSPEKPSQKSKRRRLFIAILLILCQIYLPAWGSAPPESEPPPTETTQLERALDEALDALATGMQTLVGLAEKSKDKWEQCRSGASKEAWCLKMNDALARLERLGGKESPAPPESESGSPPSASPETEKIPSEETR